MPQLQLPLPASIAVCIPVTSSAIIHVHIQPDPATTKAYLELALQQLNVYTPSSSHHYHLLRPLTAGPRGIAEDPKSP